jgi:drug/metabolite transporter (DMT)-like permease
MKLEVLIEILISILLGAAGQIFWKYGLTSIDYDFHILMSFKGWIELISNKWIFSGTLCYFVSMIIWFRALKIGELSQIYPFLSLNFIILAIVGYLLFHESLNALKILGIILVISGLLLISLSH